MMLNFVTMAHTDDVSRNFLRRITFFCLERVQNLADDQTISMQVGIRSYGAIVVSRSDHMKRRAHFWLGA
jgi:hypothetical protein